MSAGAFPSKSARSERPAARRPFRRRRSRTNAFAARRSWPDNNSCKRSTCSNRQSRRHASVATKILSYHDLAVRQGFDGRTPGLAASTERSPGHSRRKTRFAMAASSQAVRSGSVVASSDHSLRTTSTSISSRLAVNSVSISTWVGPKGDHLGEDEARCCGHSYRMPL